LTRRIKSFGKSSSRLGVYDRYAKDILRDPFYVALERNYWQLAIILIQIDIFFFAGLAVAAWQGGSLLEAVPFALSIVIWGVIVRTVFVWHQTWEPSLQVG
jgi:fatty-acid desaturase